MTNIEALRTSYLQKTERLDPNKLHILDKVKNALSCEVDITTLPYIVVLGASMDKKRGKWDLPSIVKSDHNFIVGGRTRAIASKQLINEGFRGRFLVTGGTQKDQGQEISRAGVLAKHMVDRYQVPAGQVEVIGTAGNGNTLGNVNNTISYFENNNIPIGSSIGLLTNKWHMQRSLLMFLSNPFFEEYNIHIGPINADDVLKRIDNPHMDSWIDSFNNNKYMEDRLSAEEKGIMDFLTGNYKPLGS